MCKHDTEYGQELVDSLKHIAAAHPTASLATASDTAHFIEFGSRRAKELRKMKKFRFQLLQRWLVEHFEPCRAADIGGGKGLLAYLLQQSGWDTAVIDPVYQALPDKYKDIFTGKRVKIPPTEKVRHIDRPFESQLGAHFDLLIGMHAHGCNAQIIDAAAAFDCGFILFPCCVIDEPFYPRIGVQWLESVAAYAIEQNRLVYPFRLNFKGQNIGLCSPGKAPLKLPSRLA